MSTAYDLYDPDGYVAGPPHEVFTRLRAEEPVVWQDMPGEPGSWAVLRHADVVKVAREPVLFSAATGGVVLEDLPPESLAMMQDMLLAMDPPRHLSYRRNVSPEFTPKVMARLGTRIREICSTILDDAADRTLDFVHDVCAKLPSQVVGELMGIPREDWPRIHHWSEMNSGSQDPDGSQYVDPGSTVDIVVSAGKPDVMLRSVLGLKKGEAENLLQNDGFKVVLKKRESDEPRDQVVDQSPSANTMVPSGSEVTVFFSDGPEQVPEVVGKTQEEAEQLIRDAGFEVFVTRSTDTTEKKGTVIAQNPDGGSDADQGDTVTIVVSDFEEPTETPSEIPTETPTETPSLPTETPTP